MVRVSRYCYQTGTVPMSGQLEYTVTGRKRRCADTLSDIWTSSRHQGAGPDQDLC
jgi:hypothetical protein